MRARNPATRPNHLKADAIEWKDVHRFDNK
jgi:hypothetical protein